MHFLHLGTADGEISVEDAEGSGDFQIISEIWIEPQCGFCQLPVQSIATYMNRLQYHEIPDAVSTCTYFTIYKFIPCSVTCYILIKSKSNKKLVEIGHNICEIAIVSFSDFPDSNSSN